MNSLKTLALVAAVATLSVASLRADHVLASPRGQDLHRAAIAPDTQDQLNRSFQGYNGRSPFGSRASITSENTCKMTGTDCTMKCCTSGEKVAVYTGRTGGLDVGSAVKEGCSAVGSNCTMGCCTKV